MTILLEIASRKNWRVRYGSRAFRVDFLYFVFYYGGFYHLFFFTWLYMALNGLVAAYAPWLKMNLLSSMPPVLQVITMIMVAEFVGYSEPSVAAFQSFSLGSFTASTTRKRRWPQ